MAYARAVRIWSEDELFQKSDLVVIATPTGNADVKEQEHFAGPQFRDVPVIGVLTTFAVREVLKGPNGVGSVIVHHYREGDMGIPDGIEVFYSGHEANGPTMAFFDPRLKQTFRLYLVREANGDYAPVAGQEDVNLSVMLVKGAEGSDPDLAKDAGVTRASHFDSVQGFMTAMGVFKPAKSESDLSALFTVLQLGQPEDPETGKPVAAQTIESCNLLWQDKELALVYASAAPVLEATRCEVGVLFLLKYADGGWRIADDVKVTATGKDAGISEQLTADVGTGYALGKDFPPVVTITESEGGRGYEYQASASYQIARLKLRVMTLQ